MSMRTCSDEGHLPWWGYGEGESGPGGPKAPLMLGKGLGWFQNMGTYPLLRQEGRGRREGQGKALMCGLIAFLQMEKPWRSHC